MQVCLPRHNKETGAKITRDVSGEMGRSVPTGPKRFLLIYKLPPEAATLANEFHLPFY